jgi:hypothetical protein
LESSPEIRFARSRISTHLEISFHGPTSVARCDVDMLCFPYVIGITPSFKVV